MSKKKKHKRYAMPKGMHPFEEEFFQNASADYEKTEPDYVPAPAIDLSLADIDFSDLEGDFKTDLKKLNSRYASQRNIVKKINKGRKPSSGKISPDMYSNDKFNPEPAVSHDILIPKDRDVIVQGVSDHILNRKNTGDELSEVKETDFKDDLNKFADSKINASKKVMEDKGLEDGLIAYEKGKGPTLSDIHDLMNQKVFVPKDRELIIEGGTDWLAQEVMEATREQQAQKRAQQNASIITPSAGLNADELPPFIDKNGISHTIIVPDNRELIVEGVSKFILSEQPEDNEIKAMQYYKGVKLNHLTLTFNNDSALDFNIELFNPTVPLQYLIGTRLNIDDKIQIAGGTTTYSEMLMNILANPVMIVSAQIVVAPPSGTKADIDAQLNQNFVFNNKNIAGFKASEPLNIMLNKDIFQAQPDIIYFNIMKQINRPFVPDGLDTISYKVLANNQVTINFYYKQVQIKRMVYEECREATNLL